MTDMTEVAAMGSGKQRKTSRVLLFLCLVLAITGAGGGFFATYKGLILNSNERVDVPPRQESRYASLPEDIGFVAIDPLTISLGQNSGLNLRFRAHLEIREQNREDVEMLMPRIVDVLNSYLRAIDIEDIHQTASLVRLRAQMLRRVQTVTGLDRVKDLLVMEFVVN